MCVGDQRVAPRVDARRERPDHFLPVADVDVVVGDDDELGVHELAQEAPDAEHHALRVARVLLLHADAGDAVGAALGRQVEVHDLRELAREQRHEHFVQRHAQHRRLVGRLAGVGRVIDRVAPRRDPLDREDRKALLLVVVAGVVAERPLERGLAGMDVSPRARSPRPPAPADRGSGTSRSRSSIPRSRPANWYSESVSGTGVTAPSRVAGSAPSATATGNGSRGCARQWSR